MMPLWQYIQQFSIMGLINTGIFGRMTVSMQKSGVVLSVISRTIVLLLSLGLIVFISYDTFKGINFLESHPYMEFQFWVCIVFLIDFFLGLVMAADRRAYFAHRWFFLFISIPYLNVINLFHIAIPAHWLYYVRFIPLVRGAYTSVLVTGYFSANKAFSLLTQYAVILVTIVYFCSLIFFYEERDVNSNVLSYWDALYWACMDCVTVGSYINAVTVGGKIVGVILPLCGMMMLPLFTVYVTSRVKQYNSTNAREAKRVRQVRQEWRSELDHTDTSHSGPSSSGPS